MDYSTASDCANRAEDTSNIDSDVEVTRRRHMPLRYRNEQTNESSAAAADTDDENEGIVNEKS